MAPPVFGVFVFAPLLWALVLLGSARLRDPRARGSKAHSNGESAS